MMSQPSPSALSLFRLSDPSLTLPHHLRGLETDNRRSGHNQLGAHDDMEAVRAFLREFRDSPATLKAYTKEVERLLLWAVLVRDKPLSALDRDDFAAYADFLADPQPTAMWCAPRGGRAAQRHSDKWRPFVGPLSAAAQRTALTIVNSLFNYLVTANYLAANPLALVRRRRASLRMSSAQAVLQRAFDDEEWECLLEALAKQTGPQGERICFLVALLYFLALRIGEVVTHTMGDFRLVRGRWSFFVVGKGGKPAEIPVGEQLLASLSRFRSSLGATPLPSPGDTMPLLPDASGTRPLSSRRLAQLIKVLATDASALLPEEAEHKRTHMQAASPHWFRHTALSRQAQKGLDLAHIRANARHSKLDTTLIYLHAHDDERHLAMERHTWR